MNIFQIMAANFQRGPITLRFPERVAPPAHFRGLVQIDAEQCIGCATCAYACAPGAIRVTDHTTGYEWVYDPGRCTFCARCVDLCPMQALAMQPERPPVYHQAGDLQQAICLEYPLCPECGQPAPPVNDIILARVFDEITEQVRTWSRLCERCRQQAFQPALIEPGILVRSMADER